MLLSVAGLLTERVVAGLVTEPRGLNERGCRGGERPAPTTSDNSLWTYSALRAIDLVTHIVRRPGTLVAELRSSLDGRIDARQTSRRFDRCG